MSNLHYYFNQMIFFFLSISETHLIFQYVFRLLLGYIRERKYIFIISFIQLIRSFCKFQHVQSNITVAHGTILSVVLRNILCIFFPYPLLKMFLSAIFLQTTTSGVISGRKFRIVGEFLNILGSFIRFFFN